MKPHNATIPFSIFVTLALLFSSMGVFQPVEEVQAALPTSAFGYVPSITADPFTTIQGQPGAIEVTELNDKDDAVAGPISLGFSFSFFENTYSSVYISTNGALLFATDMPDSAVRNTSIPYDLQPNNLVAPFWDDLSMAPGVSKIWVLPVSGSNPNLTIEYSHVRQYGDPSSDLNFQVVLYSNGNISFVYSTMTGDTSLATVGIEDMDGVDGLQLLYNGMGDLTLGTLPLSAKFTYPAPGARLKMMPAFQSDFLISGTRRFPVTIKNTSSTAADTFFLGWQKTSTDPLSWPIRFLDQAGNPLTDSDSDLKIDTGPIASNNSKLIYVEITSPASNPEYGKYLQGNLIATSVNDGAKTAYVKIQAANPAPFIQVYSQTGQPANFETVYPRQNPNYPGIRFSRPGTPFGAPYINKSPNLTLTPAADQYYLSAWEQQEYIFSNVQFSLAPMGMTGVSYFSNIQDNSKVSTKTFDNSPSVAMAANGYGGILFIRNEFDTQNRTRSNVFFSIVNTGGKLLQTINLTNNTSFASNSDLDIPFFKNPRLVATQSSHFIATWDKRMNLTGGADQRSIQVAEILPAGSVLSGTPCTISNTTDSIFHGVNLVNLDGSPYAVLSFLSTGGAPSVTNLILGRLTEGSPCSSPTNLGPIPGHSLDMVQADATHVLLGWVDDTYNDIRTLLVDSTAFPTNPSGLPLVNPDGRPMESLSMTPASGGYIVLTWGNVENDRLYYALMDASGTVVTPSMIFHQSNDPSIGLQTGALGASLAPISSPLEFKVSLPVISR